MKESHYILSDVKWSGGVASFHWGFFGRTSFFFLEEEGEVGGGSGLKIISHFGDNMFAL